MNHNKYFEVLCLSWQTWLARLFSPNTGDLYVWMRATNFWLDTRPFFLFYNNILTSVLGTGSSTCLSIMVESPNLPFHVILNILVIQYINIFCEMIELQLISKGIQYFTYWKANGLRKAAVFVKNSFRRIRSKRKWGAYVITSTQTTHAVAKAWLRRSLHAFKRKKRKIELTRR
jgi:hypothetical protein